MVFMPLYELSHNVSGWSVWSIEYDKSNSMFFEAKLYRSCVYFLSLSLSLSVWILLIIHFRSAAMSWTMEKPKSPRTKDSSQHPEKLRPAANSNMSEFERRPSRTGRHSVRQPSSWLQLHERLWVKSTQIKSCLDFWLSETIIHVCCFMLLFSGNLLYSDG